jgi:hypothetical protein
LENRLVWIVCKTFEQSKEKMKMKTEPSKEILKKFEFAIHTPRIMKRFKKQLVDQGVNTIVRRNDQGRIHE